MTRALVNALITLGAAPMLAAAQVPPTPAAPPCPRAH